MSSSSVVSRTSRITGTRLSVGHAEDLGLDPDDGLEWVTLCDAHDTLVYSENKTQALRVNGPDFCDDCRTSARRRKATIISRTSKETGLPVTVASVASLGVEPTGGKRWLVSCDEHDTYAYTRTKQRALTTSTVEFCQQCRDLASQSPQ
ncbi:hypothetical protein [Curtobacterium sp. MCBD17_040]|uniref:hypothetical protein n=1 Tax=Curtobacterium sp. MCBD17_040 TaxID=2175674 RepID=UPI0011B4C61B|nr:hypothetical protein [Curtobacterium sp. MCBD17_040]WIB65894.1 hypothetical protein DEI94_17415 [Curtobacterium sp. MCBD17_040]